MSHLLYKLKDILDLEFFIDNIEYMFPEALDMAFSNLKNIQIVKAMSGYGIIKEKALQEMFIEDFAGQTEREFKGYYMLIIRALKLFLVEQYITL